MLREYTERHTHTHTHDVLQYVLRLSLLMYCMNGSWECVGFSVDLFRIGRFFFFFFLRFVRFGSTCFGQMNAKLNWKLSGINIKWENCNISSFHRIIRQSNFSLFVHELACLRIIYTRTRIQSNENRCSFFFPLRFDFDAEVRPASFLGDPTIYALALARAQAYRFAISCFATEIVEK